MRTALRPPGRSSRLATLAHFPGIAGLAGLALACALVVTACGGSRGGSRGGGPSGDTWGVTARIPADTPYLFAALTPAPDAVLQKFAATVELQLAQAHRQLLPLLAGSSSPWAKVASTLLDEIRTQKPTQWWQNAGFAPGGRFAFHGLSLWPVMRLEVAKLDIVKKTVQRYLDLSQMQVRPVEQGEWTIWQLTFGEAAVVIAVNPREAVVSAMPAKLTAKMIPWLTGARKPERSLADDNALPTLMNQHSFLPYLLGAVDLQEIIAILSGRVTGATRELGESLQLAEVAGCAADIDRLAVLTPRLAFGYSKFDEKGFSGGFVVEMPPNAVTSLRRLLTATPSVTWPVPGRPMFAMVASFDVGNTLALFGELGQAIQAQPFRCSALASLNEAGASLRRMASTPLPPIVTGLRGLLMVMEEGTTEPLNLVGHIVAAGEQLDTLPSLMALIPGLGGISIPGDGTPAALPVEQLGLGWAKTAHAALRADRLVVAVGGGSAGRAAEQIKAVPQKPAPLFGMSFDFAKVAKMSPQAAESLTGYQSFIDATIAIELRDEGLRMNFDGTW